MYKQVIIILAASYNFIRPLIKDFKKNLVNVTNKYEERLYEFLKKGALFDVFEPIYTYYPLAQKEDFNYEENPLLFALEHYENDIYKEVILK